MWSTVHTPISSHLPLPPLYFSRYETVKAGNAVAALKASLKPLATAKRNGKWQSLDAALLVPGDLVLLASGSAVPADCLVSMHAEWHSHFQNAAHVC